MRYIFMAFCIVSLDICPAENNEPMITPAKIKVIRGVCPLTLTNEAAVSILKYIATDAGLRENCCRIMILLVLAAGQRIFEGTRYKECT